jgi:hypothetical protein
MGKKVKLMPLPKLLKKAEYTFNKWIREVRDKDEPCISCGKHCENYDAGHYVPAGKSAYLRFNEWNVSKECKKCNAFDSFHLVGYRKNLINKIRIENVEWLENNRFILHSWSREQLNFIIEKYS